MKRQLLFIGLLITILGAGAKLGPGFAIQTILVAGGEVDAATAQQVLAATVQIVLLAEVSGPEFLNLIRYRDGSTLVLAAPVELLQSGALTPAETGSSQRAGWGTVVTVVYRQPGTGARDGDFARLAFQRLAQHFTLHTIPLTKSPI